MTSFALFPTAIGDCAIAWRGDRVTATHLPERSREETAVRFASRTGGSEVRPPAIVREAIEAIVELLDGKSVSLNHIACDLRAIEPLAVRVYDVARAVPVGETVTYGEIAAQLGDRQLAQAVGRALGRNPLPIIVPCHRVVGANGKLTGFSAPGGIETKLKMLAIEGAYIGGTRSLFDDL